MQFELADVDYAPEAQRLHPYDLHCSGCGRYAKHVASEYHYDGWANVLYVTTSCTRCGVHTEPWG